MSLIHQSLDFPGKMPLLRYKFSLFLILILLCFLLALRLHDGLLLLAGAALAVPLLFVVFLIRHAVWDYNLQLLCIGFKGESATVTVIGEVGCAGLGPCI